MLRRRNLMFVKSSGDLPIGFTRLEFIESTGTQWIQTGIKQARFEFDIAFSNTHNRDLMGNSAAGGQYWGATTGKTSYEFAGNNINLNPTIRRIVTYNNIDSKAISLSADGITHINARTYSDIPTEFTVLAIVRTQYACNAKLYGFRAYDESDNMIADYIPALDKQGRPCMYDTVSKQPKYSDGTGEFSAGKEM